MSRPPYAPSHLQHWASAALNSRHQNDPQAAEVFITALKLGGTFMMAVRPTAAGADQAPIVAVPDRWEVARGGRHAGHAEPRRDELCRPAVESR